MEHVQTLNVLKGHVKTFDELLGRILYKVTADDEVLTLYLSETNYVRFQHHQNCCESVYIESIVGDLEDLVGEPLLMAEEVSDYSADPLSEWADSYTWTFYKFATRKGYVDVRWYGTSNGYYSESVSVEVVSTTEEY